MAERAANLELLHDFSLSIVGIITPWVNQHRAVSAHVPFNGAVIAIERP